MMRTCVPSLFPWLPAVLLLSFSLHAAEAAGTTEHPGEHLDSMGSYHFKNRLQCQNLCRYQRLCQRYSYRQLEAPGSGEENCVLHADIGAGSGSGAALPPGWTGDTPPSSGSGADCLSQPCGDTEFCAPSHTSPFYKCLPQPARCPSEINVTNGYADVSGTQQGDVAYLHCMPSFAFFPRHDHGAVNVTCLVTSKWTDSRRLCKQIIFDNERVPFTTQLPEMGINEGWSMCIRGNFTGPLKFTVNLKSGNDFWLHLDFRGEQLQTEVNDSVIWDTNVKGTWQGWALLGDFPLTPGDRFTLAIWHDGESLQVLFEGHSNMTLQLSERQNLPAMDTLEIVEDVILDRVSLYDRNCTCCGGLPPFST